MLIEFVDKSDISKISDFLSGINKDDLVNKNTYILGAFEDDTLIGTAVFNVDSGVVDIISICVSEEDQKKGVGLSLVQNIVNIAASYGLKILRASIDDEDEEKGIGEFLWKSGLTCVRSASLSTITLESFMSNPQIKRSKASFDNDANIKNASEVPNSMIIKFLEKQNLEQMIGSYDEMYSAVNLNGTEVDGCCLVALKDGKPALECLLATGNKLSPFGMLIKSAERLCTNFPMNTRIEFLAVSDKAEEMASSFLPYREQTEIFTYQMHIDEMGDEETFEVNIPENIDGGKKSMEDIPHFYPLMNSSLACGKCRYCIKDTGVLKCHRYVQKPAEVLEGSDCLKFEPIPSIKN